MFELIPLRNARQSLAPGAFSLFLLLALVIPTAEGETEPDLTVSIKSFEHALELLSAHPLIDGHNDLPWLIREESKGDPAVFEMEQRNEFDTDIPRLREGRVGGQFWSVWIPAETPQQDLRRVQREQIATVHRLIDSYPETFEFAGSAADIQSAFDRGKIASLIGMEGGYALENSIDAVAEFYDLGVRYMALTHNTSLDWAGAGLGEHRNRGLTGFGRAVVREMNRVGMLVDLSHTSDQTMHDVLDISTAPVIWSHAAARALVDHPRNVPDDVLRRVPVNGGVVMVTFISAFIDKEVMRADAQIWNDTQVLETVRDFREVWSAYDDRHEVPRATVAAVAEHIEHVRNIAGIDHVGIGSDFWGMNDMPVGLEDVSGFPLLIALLVERGWSDEDLIKLMGANILRALESAASEASQACC